MGISIPKNFGITAAMQVHSSRPLIYENDVDPIEIRFTSIVFEFSVVSYVLGKNSSITQLNKFDWMA